MLPSFRTSHPELHRSPDLTPTPLPYLFQQGHLFVTIAVDIRVGTSASNFSDPEGTAPHSKPLFSPLCNPRHYLSPDASCSPIDLARTLLSSHLNLRGHQRTAYQVCVHAGHRALYSLPLPQVLFCSCLQPRSAAGPISGCGTLGAVPYSYVTPRAGTICLQSEFHLLS